MVRQDDKNKRACPRIPMEIDVEVHCPNSLVHVLRTVDLSHSGLLLVMDSPDRPPVGSQLKIQVVGRLGNGERPPLVEARVVRHVDKGFAVLFENV